MLYCYKSLANARSFKVVRGKTAAIYLPIVNEFASVYKEIEYFLIFSHRSVYLRAIKKTL